MQQIAIVGVGPTGLYTFANLIGSRLPLSVTLYEQSDQAGEGMPFDDETNHQIMLANIASIEIPELTCSYLEWLKEQPTRFLSRYGVDKESLHERQFLPRILLGDYFRHQLLQLVEDAQNRGHDIHLFENCKVTDIALNPDNVILWTNRDENCVQFDMVIVATGHVWPQPSHYQSAYLPSPWNGLINSKIPPCQVGILGTSLSGIDAAFAVAVQHGQFIEQPDDPHISLRFDLSSASDGLCITLMSRSGLLPEADFYCPIPHEPLQIVTSDRIQREIEIGSVALLDRVYRLMVREISMNDPRWSEHIALHTLSADTFSTAYFADRTERNPFGWAYHNLKEVEQNKQDKHTVAWRYTLLRLHEQVEEIVPHLTPQDRKRFNSGLKRVFVDNYAAIPPESIRRLLALREAGVVRLLALGDDYSKQVSELGTTIATSENQHHFQLFIDARGQKALKLDDLPFPTLRKQLMDYGKDLPPLAENYTLMLPDGSGHRLALAALPFLLHDRPFAQGITVSAEIGKAIGKSLDGKHIRRRPWIFDH